MANRTWRQVTEKTIINRFRKTIFAKEVENDIEADVELVLNLKMKHIAKNGKKFKNHSDFPKM